MVSDKTLRFWGNYAKSQPADMPKFVWRRLGESLKTAPSGNVTTRVGSIELPLDMSIHRIMAKYYFRTHEMFLERVFRKFLKSGDIFLDVGANYGYWSAFCANLVGPEGELHLFEPVPHHFQSLKKLQSLNPRYKFIPVQAAVGAEVGTAEMDVVIGSSSNFENYDVSPASNSLLKGFLPQGLTETHTVPVLTLDGYLKEQQIDVKRIGFIKVDVEGFEWFALQGMQDILQARVPMLIEVVTDTARSPHLNGARIIELLEGYGYDCLNATTLQPVAKNNLGVEENLVFL